MGGMGERSNSFSLSPWGQTANLSVQVQNQHHLCFGGKTCLKKKKREK